MNLHVIVRVTIICILRAWRCFEQYIRNTPEEPRLLRLLDSKFVLIPLDVTH